MDGAASVFVDANVWYSRTRRDWLGMLYTVPEVPAFQVHWTEDVLAELLREVAEQMQAYWFQRRGESNLPLQLRKAECPQFAERVRRHLLQRP